MFQLLECSPLPQFAVGLDNKITYWNKACEALTGFKAAEMIGTDRHWEPFYSHKRPIVADLVLNNDLNSFFQLYQDKNPGQSRIIPNAWEAFDWFRMCGQPLHLHFMAAPVFNEQGKLVGAVETLHDLSGRMLAMLAPSENTPPGLAGQTGRTSFLRHNIRFGLLVGNSPAMQRVYDLLAKAAGSNANVIIYGESGTGKEVVARTIHDLSHLAKRNFVAVNCGAIPETLAESEFFGYRKGAFTGANTDREGYLDQADGGTLFLDEIGEISLAMQVKLLRVLEGSGFCPVGSRETRKPDVRIVGATSRDMEQLVRDGRIRRDFFYRIHVIPVQLPPLRDRKEDLRALTDHFISKFNQDNREITISEEIYQRLEQYPWPGNVRELQNVIQRYLTLGELVFTPAGPGAPGAPVVAEHPGTDKTLATPALNTPGVIASLPSAPEVACVHTDSAALLRSHGGLEGMISTIERELIRQALESNQWHRENTAMMLDISRKTLFRKMRHFNL
ncbi:sigma-54 interaction domain-containing protein [Desulfurivibrio dismutans]|uniref:sigma-54 interaction domain-containing protein n=1 Tax=Desulfurivibrio dismutans TaxID=1398908 RepID=UPI0023DB39A7|nr:sigma 54-interacting transcriptional regulator [Desulfurivibrio alkaliphilus]MDF1615358.1 sigma 54-interacting transcriptional regulator [Desulfurivibrio alkaliphilus]